MGAKLARRARDEIKQIGVLKKVSLRLKVAKPSTSESLHSCRRVSIKHDSNSNKHLQQCNKQIVLIGYRRRSDKSSRRSIKDIRKLNIGISEKKNKCEKNSKEITSSHYGNSSTNKTNCSRHNELLLRQVELSKSDSTLQHNYITDKVVNCAQGKYCQSSINLQTHCSREIIIKGDLPVMYLRPAILI